MRFVRAPRPSRCSVPPVHRSSSLERSSILSRPEIGELREAGGHLRGASSTMPQKANPIESEAVVGLSVLAAQQVPALLAAMQGEHERSAGEWQIEWDALPLVCVYGAGALSGTGRILDGLQVFPELMSANLALDGGLLMAEAAMMAIAPNLALTTSSTRPARKRASAPFHSLSQSTTLPATSSGLRWTCPRFSRPPPTSVRPSRSSTTRSRRGALRGFARRTTRLPCRP